MAQPQACTHGSSPEGAALKLAVLHKVVPQLRLRPGRQVAAAAAVVFKVEARAAPQLHDEHLGQPVGRAVICIVVAVDDARHALQAPAVSREA